MDIEISEKTVVTPTVEATIIGMMVSCPVCGTENAPGEKYCGDCGFLLSSAPGEPVQAVEAVEQARLADPEGRREYLLSPGENTVGREGTDVLLSDPSVSRRHALLTLEAGQCWIEDIGSTNGTFLNGSKLTPNARMPLNDGDEVVFGRTTLSFKTTTGQEPQGAA